jgi:hypothetical protein
MRAIALAILVVGCRHDDPSPHPATPLAPQVAAVVQPQPAQLADAAIPDAAMPDAAVPDASDDPDFSFYDGEAIGPLHVRMTDNELIAVLGKPRSRQKPSEEGATGEWVGAWTWVGASALMVSDTRNGPRTARDVSVIAPSTYATKRGIHLGSTRADVERLYPRSPDDQQQDPDSYVVGSVYGGLLFSFAHDRVTSISIGVFAF